MFKYAVVVLALVACAAAKPLCAAGQSVNFTSRSSGEPPLHLQLFAAPAPYVTGHSSQVSPRNYNGIASAPVIAPVATPFAAPVAAPVVAKYAAAPLAAPLAYRAAPSAYTHPVAAPLAAPLTYSHPLPYATASAPLLF
ncbi:LOW QUALITY PROTEIN: cyclin-dependent kinase inhibitor 1C-like [Drosophila busckii]|uniref:LOW QUALITY PROTEIN: cyclin-dependent kinase inhibitor 1C-like n=1 Tax=Drosophila busckii TaxID=30019 RepID=UPI001433261E|nr:LOW QUALITY PROTEIN: cyclin-dependent kinase inhibitor 1C-like [Drosophila busckii]